MKTHPATPSSIPPDTPWILSKVVLNDAGLNGDLHLLGPGAERAATSAAPGATVLFVVAGPVTVSVGAKNFILQSEETLQLPPGAQPSLVNPNATPAKVLVLTLPPPAPRRIPAGFAALDGYGV